MQITFHQIPSPVDPELSSRWQTSFDKHVTRVRDPFSVTLNQTSHMHLKTVFTNAPRGFCAASGTQHGMFERVGTRFPGTQLEPTGPSARRADTR
jgi:hypothetical protein